MDFLPNSELTCSRGANNWYPAAVMASGARGGGGGKRTSQMGSEPYRWVAPNVLLHFRSGSLASAALHGASAADAAVSCAGVEALPAHIFSAAETAARQAESGATACICLLGESGSGKSEAAKQARPRKIHSPPSRRYRPLALGRHRCRALVAGAASPAPPPFTQSRVSW